MAGTAKWGAGTFNAWLRLGLRELRAAIYPVSDIAREAEMGTWGTLTPGEVVEQKRGDTEPAKASERTADRHSFLEERLKQYEPARETRERMEPEHEKG
jgi:hypothetical protein